MREPKSFLFFSSFRSVTFPDSDFRNATWRNPYFIIITKYYMYSNVIEVVDVIANISKLSASIGSLL